MWLNECDSCDGWFSIIGCGFCREFCLYTTILLWKTIWKCWYLIFLVDTNSPSFIYLALCAVWCYFVPTALCGVVTLCFQHLSSLLAAPWLWYRNQSEHICCYINKYSVYSVVNVLSADRTISTQAIAITFLLELSTFGKHWAYLSDAFNFAIDMYFRKNGNIYYIYVYLYIYIYIYIH